MIDDEAALVVERENGKLITQGLLVQLAAGSILSSEMGKKFDKKVKSMTVKTRAIGTTKPTTTKWPPDREEE